MTVEIHSLNPRQMDAFLERRRAVIAFASEMSLADNLAEILRKANEFVPSAAGSILLDNPLDKQPDKSQNLLTFVAAFGDKATGLIGSEIPADQGIAGRVYASGFASFVRSQLEGGSPLVQARATAGSQVTADATDFGKGDGPYLPASSFTMPVRKGEYYMVTVSESGAGGSARFEALF